jgi:hypothetical protein
VPHGAYGDESGQDRDADPDQGRRRVTRREDVEAAASPRADREEDGQAERAAELPA